MGIVWLPHPICGQYPALFHLSFASVSPYVACGPTLTDSFQRYTGPGGMQEHLHHLQDLRYSSPFEGDPSSAYGGFGHSLKGTRVGLYPELSDVILLSLAQPISNVHGCRHGGLCGRVHHRRPMPYRQ